MGTGANQHDKRLPHAGLANMTFHSVKTLVYTVPNKVTNIQYNHLLNHEGVGVMGMEGN